MDPKIRSNTTWYPNIFLLIGLVGLFGLAVLGGQLLGNNQAVLSVISSAGYIGVFIAAFIAGLNVLIPIPVATLTPLFVSAGLAIPAIIVTLALGTLAADAVGYFIGHTGRAIIATKYPRVLRYTEKIADQHPIVIMLFVGAYAAFVPLPNEVILIPLALSGISWRLLVIPLFVGALVIQTLLVTGVSLLPTFI